MLHVDAEEFRQELGRWLCVLHMIYIISIVQGVQCYVTAGWSIRLG